MTMADNDLIGKSIKRSLIMLIIGALLSGLSGLSYLAFISSYLSYATIVVSIGSILMLIASIKLGRVSQPFKLATKGIIGVIMLMACVLTFDLMTLFVQKENFVTMAYILSTLLSIISLLIYVYTVYNVIKGCRALVTGGLSSSYGHRTFYTFVVLNCVFALFAVISMIMYTVSKVTEIEVFRIIYKAGCSCTAALSFSYSTVIAIFICRTYRKVN